MRYRDKKPTYVRTRRFTSAVALTEDTFLHKLMHSTSSALTVDLETLAFSPSEMRINSFRAAVVYIVSVDRVSR